MTSHEVINIIVYSADRIEVTYNFEDEFARCSKYVAAYGESHEKEAV